MLRKEEIIDQAIKEIAFHREEKGGCELCDVFYLLENGASFRLPGANQDFVDEEPSPQAEIAHLPQVIGRCIVAVWCNVHDGQLVFDTVSLGLDDGTHLYDVPCAPMGVCLAGIHIVTPDKVNRDILFDFWDERKFQLEIY